eukprot:TRINITY_DN3587_c0_g1_i1.p1 TRINITY_DN3587_c0_g1~~TRINITY_DN3587_c0_g1_i1.p1  ORF type:complete len:292 (+),score=65.87 TRINITY_DN3587_c0_g1_i1:70-945(+)
MLKRRIGIVGYGELGRFLTRAVLEREADGRAELAFVWNRSRERIDADGVVPSDRVLSDLGSFGSRRADLIVEVAHPSITREYGARFLENSDYMPGSPTAFADPQLEELVRSAARGETRHSLYIPSGAMWGAQDIQRMARAGALAGLKVQMSFHPMALKLVGDLGDRVADLLAKGESAEPDGVVLYDGPVRGVCSLAPNNVNTMACAAMAASPALGFDSVQGRLVAHWDHAHEVSVEVEGPVRADCGGDRFRVATLRHNPAKPGAVTGTATYLSFVSSMFDAGGRRPGLHFV